MISSYLSDRSVTVLISADSKEDVGWKSGRGAQNAWAASPAKQNDKCFPPGDTHKQQNTQIPQVVLHLCAPVRGILTFKN